MLHIPGYQVSTQIYDGSRTQVYRGYRLSDGQSVVIKCLKSPYPTFNELVQFRHQYTITKNLNFLGIVQPIALENYRHSLALIMEDFGGISLQEKMNHQPLELELFLKIAIQTTEILDYLYHHHIIHKDIKPQNILIHPQTQKIKLIDFSIASLLPRENREIQQTSILEGTLAYISPEQTGRMNRGIDYRTDFYSLGVTFYELLTGKLPFNADDAMELVHSHIAKPAILPHQINPNIPPILSDIVIKLMAKMAEDRYQSALGLKHDLEICQQEWQSLGDIPHFKLAQRDFSDRFVIPEKLYGRETEVQTLLTAFERIARKNSQSELMLVTGFSGIGKTAVVREIYKPIVRQKGYFISGKFDQFQRNIPFSALVQALQKLIEQLLTENNDQIKAWQNKILSVLRENAQIIIDVIPELEKILGKQPKVSELSGSASQNRFNLLFSKFIKLFAKIEHPLVIFLDDLQWADSASLQFLQILMSDVDTPNLLLIGAYRNNEVNSAHPLLLTIDEIIKNNAIVNQINLKTLNYQDLNQLIADTLNCTATRAKPLTDIVLEKTQGNPFFSNQFLKSLHQEGLIYFDTQAGYWQCDISQIKQLSISDNVVEFMSTELQKLPHHTQDILKLAACIGNQFDINTLAVVYEKSLIETANTLWKALEIGLILPLNDVYRFYQSPQLETTNSTTISCKYKFLHDRVQQAAYSLIPESQKRNTHLKIGKLLIENIPEDERNEKIFDIVNQLNYGRELIYSLEERIELAKLNLIAGSKANSATAYKAAFDYFHLGINLLPDNSWQSHYQLTLALHESAAQAAYLSADFTSMKELIKVVLEQATTLLEKVKIYEVKIQALMAQNEQLAALNTAIPVLELLGVEFPQQPDLQIEINAVNTYLTNKQISDLIDLPEMKDSQKLATMRILSTAISAAYIAMPTMLPLIVLKQVNLSIQYGNSADSAFGYANYGLILADYLEDIDAGYQFGRLAENLVDKLNAKHIKSKAILNANGWVRHWKEHSQAKLKPLLEAYTNGLETGDLEFGGYSIFMYCLTSYFLGKELSSLSEKMTAYSQALEKLKQKATLSWLNIGHQTVLNLLEKSETTTELAGTVYQQNISLPFHIQANDRLAIFSVYAHKMILGYLFSKFSQAMENANLAEPYLDGVAGTIYHPIFYFYDSLLRLAIYPQETEIEQTKILERITNNQSKMAKWAHHCPVNFSHQYHLVEAEKYHVLNQQILAMENYDLAIKFAQENQYQQDAALANELAAKFYLAWGKEKIAKTYMIDAYYGYARWGAKAKITELETHYPQLLKSILNKEVNFKSCELISQSINYTVTETNSAICHFLDLGTVVKASQTLLGEIRLENLLANLMQLIIENAGASKCVLMLEKEDNLFIEATAIIDEEIEVLQSLPMAANIIPTSVINYVWHKNQTLVIDDVINANEWNNDQYIIQYQPQSILCSSLVNQGKKLGIIYLENQLTKQAFTPNRIELVKIICTQAAISLENANLYQNLELKVQLRTQELNHKNQQLEKTLAKLKQTQQQIIAQEKLASLGALTAGIAHEIKNPLNFVNNFAELSTELVEELIEEMEAQKSALESDNWENIFDILSMINENVMKINEHGKRADSIVKGMLMHSSGKIGELRQVDINALLSEYVNLAYHGLRAKDPNFNIGISSNYDPEIGKINIIPQNISRVILNLVNNACYAAHQKKVQLQIEDNQQNVFLPQLTITTKNLDDAVEIRIRDNGLGIPEELQSKIFNPFFTTKPTGVGTGLGLSISHDIIVKEHQGELKLETELGNYTEFIMILPKTIS